MSPAISISLEDHVCPTCATPFAIAERIGETARMTGQDFYCPNGHVCSYRDHETKRLREQLAREQTAHAQARAARDAAEQKLARVHRGTCPLCRRHFVNVERHMKSKHKEKKP